MVMLGVIRSTTRLVQRGQVQYDPNIFKQLIIKGNGWEIEHDESDDIEKTKRREELDSDFYKMPQYINPFENPSVKPKTFTKTPNKWGGTTITME
tara:strand:- start:18 stop:302 length:285 start_codon:yes stop_codon:yes gene_type:complete